MMGDTEKPSPKYSSDEKEEIISKITDDIQRTREHPESDQIYQALYEKYYSRFLDGELSKEELQEFNGDWVKALKEKDRKKQDDFIESEGWQLRRVGIADINSRPLSDFGNAERLVDQAGFYIRFCHHFSSWFIFKSSEGRWKKDEVGYINRVGKEVIRGIHIEAAKAPIPEATKATSSWAIRCEDKTHLNAMIDLATFSKKIVILPHDLDSDDYLFNLKNGTFDLKECVLKEHQRDNYISKLADYEYNENAKCPLWESYLDRIFRSRKDKTELIQFLQRAVGYTLTGSTEEQCLFLLYGSGANGKSVFLDVLNALLGEYGAVTQSKTFTTDRGEINNDIAALTGARMVYASENPSDTHLDESIIKQLTGGELISARFLHQEFFTFKPRFKIWWAFNHPPAVSDMTNSIWRRIKIIPFEEVLPESEWDKSLASKLKSELPGIFNWAITGLKQYYELKSLKPPKAVVDTTKEYKEDQDILHDFLADMCEFRSDDSPFGKPFEIKANHLYEQYKSWLTYNGDDKPMSSTKFGRLLRDKQIKKSHKEEGWYYLGIRFVEGKVKH